MQYAPTTRWCFVGATLAVARDARITDKGACPLVRVIDYIPRNLF